MSGKKKDEEGQPALIKLTAPPGVTSITIPVEQGQGDDKGGTKLFVVKDGAVACDAAFAPALIGHGFRRQSDGQPA